MSQMIVGRGKSPLSNLISNGSFVTHADGWYRHAGDETLAFAAGTSRNDGSGSLSVTHGASDSGVAAYRPGGAPTIALRVTDTLDAIVFAQCATAEAIIGWEVTFYSEAAGLNQLGVAQGPATHPELAADTWTPIGIYGVPIPDGSTHVRVRITTSAAGEGEIVYLDDVFFGQLISAPFPVTVIPSGENRVANGDFEDASSDTLPWDKVQYTGTELFVRSTSSPLAGTASLHVTLGGQVSNQGVYNAGGAAGPLAIPGEELTLSFLIKGSGTIEAVMDWVGGATSESVVWTSTLTGALQTVSVTHTVPAGAFEVWPTFRTTTAAAAEFWLDSVSVTGSDA
jgi:hypothetical protein